MALLATAVMAAWPAAGTAQVGGPAEVEQLIAEGRIEEAGLILKARLAEAPQDSEALFLLGVVYNRAERYLESVPVLQAAQAGHPVPGRVRYHLGAALWNLGRAQEAVVELEEASVLLQDPTEAWYLLARIDLEQGREEQAAGRLETVLERRPGHAGALFRRGMVDYRAGRLEPALARFDACLAADPGLLEAAYNRGLTLLRLGRREEGERALAEFRVAQAERRRQERAGMSVRKARDMASDARELLAQEGPGPAELAAGLIRRARELAPDWTELDLMLAEALDRAGDADGARAARERYEAGRWPAGGRPDSRPGDGR